MAGCRVDRSLRGVAFEVVPIGRKIVGTEGNTVARLLVAEYICERIAIVTERPAVLGWESRQLHCDKQGEKAQGEGRTQSVERNGGQQETSGQADDQVATDEEVLHRRKQEDDRQGNGEPARNGSRRGRSERSALAPDHPERGPAIPPHNRTHRRAMSLSVQVVAENTPLEAKNPTAASKDATFGGGIHANACASGREAT